VPPIVIVGDQPTSSLLAIQRPLEVVYFKFTVLAYLVPYVHAWYALVKTSGSSERKEYFEPNFVTKLFPS
jgi:hypothetical protein